MSFSYIWYKVSNKFFIILYNKISLSSFSLFDLTTIFLISQIWYGSITTTPHGAMASWYSRVYYNLDDRFDPPAWRQPALYRHISWDLSDT